MTYQSNLVQHRIVWKIHLITFFTETSEPVAKNFGGMVLYKRCTRLIVESPSSLRFIVECVFALKDFSFKGSRELLLPLGIRSSVVIFPHLSLSLKPLVQSGKGGPWSSPFRIISHDPTHKPRFGKKL